MHCIADKMTAVLSEPRKLKDTIPKVLMLSVPPKLLGMIIGPKGKTVQELISTHGVSNINIEDDGSIQVESFSAEKNEAVKAAIEKIVDEGTKKDAEKKDGGSRGEKKDSQPLGPPPEVGVIYRECEVKGVHPWGVFVEILPGYEGLVHISELDVRKVASPDKAGITAGQKLDVKYLGKNEKGQMRLSRRVVLLRDAGKEEGSALPPTTNPSPPTASSAAAEAAYS